MATIADFDALDVRVGTVTAVEDFPEAQKPAYKLTIDFGPEIGVKHSSAQLTENYSKADLEGLQVMCVVNIPPRQIGPFISQCLTLGIPDGSGGCIVVSPERSVVIGGKLY